MEGYLHVLLLVLCGCMSGRAVEWDWDEPNDLDAYINAPEDVYGYEVLDIFPVTGATVHVLNLTSLTWFDETLTTTPVWWHYLCIVIPDTVTYNDAALLYVAGGFKNESIPTMEDDETLVESVNFAVNTGAVVSLLKDIPNQPLYFTNENGEVRSEDAIVAYSWQLYIEATFDDTSVDVLFPMAKATKLSLDTLIEYAASVDPSLAITQVMPTGRNKDGWAAGLLACVDQRILAASPLVIDILNWFPNLMHHYQSMGGWSWAFVPYWNAQVPYNLHNPRTKTMADLIDPYNYRPRLTMPGFWHAAAGDQFFLADDSHYWLKNLSATAEIHFMMFENEDHSLDNHRDVQWSNMESFFILVKEGTPRPDYSFVRDDMSNPGTITLTSVTTPTYVKAWVAENTNRTCEPNDDPSGVCRRDFRVSRNDIPTDTLISWREEPVEDLGGGQYRATYPVREDFGYRIFHIEASYPGPGGREFRVTSEVNIMPNTFPYPACVTPEECQGVLK